MTLSVIQDPAPAPSGSPRFSIVILTYARDDTLKATLAHLRGKLGPRDDVEIVLVDNNTDQIDRADLISAFPRRQVIKTLVNKGVSARNDGMAAARGETIALLDDDVLVDSGDFLDRFQAAFEAEPAVGVIMCKKLDVKTMTQLPECVPHTRKNVDASQPFLTFRFVGGLVGVRRAMFLEVGGFSPEFFFGLEEHEYSFRIIQAGWKILYIPQIIAIETNASGGRNDIYEYHTEVLCNRYMVAHLHMPLLSMILNQILFTIYLYVIDKGRIDVGRAIRKYMEWRRRPQRARRRPIDAKARAYIRACGGVTWR